MTPSNRREAGRRRLAMRLPQMRQLIMNAREPWQLEIFEAYQTVVEARESVRLQSLAGLVEEYDEACLEIEQHVVKAMHKRF
jgi:hypothetical protein